MRRCLLLNQQLLFLQRGTEFPGSAVLCLELGAEFQSIPGKGRGLAIDKERLSKGIYPTADTALV